MRITLAQVDAHLGDIDANVDLAASVIAEAAKDSSELIVFPELHLSGYSIGAVDADLAMRPDDPRIEKLARQAGSSRSSSGGRAASRSCGPVGGFRGVREPRTSHLQQHGLLPARSPHSHPPQAVPAGLRPVRGAEPLHSRTDAAGVSRGAGHQG